MNYHKVISEYIAKDLKIYDFHTHLFPATYSGFMLYGLENLLNYHYLHAEYLGLNTIKPHDFFKLSTPERAKRVWQELFVERLPASEATMGVLTVLQKLDIEPMGDYNSIASAFPSLSQEEYIEEIFNASNVEKVVMTNDIFDPQEIGFYDESDPKFVPSIRLDSYFNLIENKITFEGKTYHFPGDLDLYLETMINKLKPAYLALSVGDSLRKHSGGSIFLEDQVFKFLQKYSIPMVLMLGVKRQVNTNYKLAGDSVVNFDMQDLTELVKNNPGIKFYVTALSREDQYGLVVLARKFPNLKVFGIWWFLNNSSFIEEITRMRINLLGMNFVPQHSDARVMEQLIYKWEHSLNIFEDIFSEYFEALTNKNVLVNEEIIKDTIDDFINGETRKLL